MKSSKSFLQFLFSGVIRFVSVCALCGGLFYCSAYPAYLFQMNTKRDQANYESIFDDLDDNQNCKCSESNHFNDKKKNPVKKIEPKSQQKRNRTKSRPELENVSLEDIYNNFLRHNQLLYKSSEFAHPTQKYSYDYSECDKDDNFIENKYTHKTSSSSDVSLISISKGTKSKLTSRKKRTNDCSSNIQRNKNYFRRKPYELRNKEEFENNYKSSFLTPSLRKTKIKSILKKSNVKNNISNENSYKTKTFEKELKTNNLFSDEDSKEKRGLTWKLLSSDSSISGSLFCPPLIENGCERNKLFVSCSDLSMSYSDSSKKEQIDPKKANDQGLILIEKSSYDIESLKSASDSFYELDNSSNNLVRESSFFSKRRSKDDCSETLSSSDCCQSNIINERLSFSDSNSLVNAQDDNRNRLRGFNQIRCMKNVIKKNQNVPSNNNLFSGEILDNPQDEQIDFNRNAEYLNVSRSLDSIPAWVPEVKINNQSENFTSLYPTAATENFSYLDKTFESRTSSESVKSQSCTSHKSFRAPKNKMVDLLKYDSQTKIKTSIELLVENCCKNKKSTLFCVNKSKKCFFKDSLKSKTPFENFLISQVEKTNENGKRKTALKSACKERNVENYSSNPDTDSYFSDSSASLFSVQSNDSLTKVNELILTTSFSSY